MKKLFKTPTIHFLILGLLFSGTNVFARVEKSKFDPSRFNGSYRFHSSRDPDLCHREISVVTEHRKIEQGEYDFVKITPVIGRGYSSLSEFEVREYTIDIRNAKGSERYGKVKHIWFGSGRQYTNGTNHFESTENHLCQHAEYRHFNTGRPYTLKNCITADDDGTITVTQDFGEGGFDKPVSWNRNSSRCVYGKKI